MKHTLTALFYFSVVVCSAQIQFTKSDFGANGDKVIYAIDSPATSAYNYGATGANYTWQFNTRTNRARRYDSTIFLTATNNPNAPTISTNLLARSYANGDQYLEVSDSFVKTIFDFPQFNVTGVKLKTLPFPLTYQSVFVDSTKAVAKGLMSEFGLDPLPPFDSIKIEANVKISGICDGWGTLILPDTTSYNTLKLNRQISIEADIYLHSILGWTYVTHRSQHTASYNWYAPDSKDYLASVQLDTSGNITNFIYKIKKAPPVIKTPKVVSISPDNMRQGDTISILVKASNTLFTAEEPQIDIWYCNVLNLQIIDDTTLIVTITCPFASTPGILDFRLYILGYGPVYLLNAFTITPSPEAPKLISAGPTFCAIGKLTTITVTASHTHFTKGLNLNFYPDSISQGTIFVQSYTVLNDTTFTCNILVENTAGYVPFTLYTSNSTDGSLQLKGALIVTHTGLSEEQKSLVKLYPNPVREQLTIVLPPSQSSVLIQLFDINGKELKHIVTGEKEIIIRTNDLNSAFYILKITGDTLNVTQKIFTQP
jgi:hypothetical protein